MGDFKPLLLSFGLLVVLTITFPLIYSSFGLNIDNIDIQDWAIPFVNLLESILNFFSSIFGFVFSWMETSFSILGWLTDWITSWLGWGSIGDFGVGLTESLAYFFDEFLNYIYYGFVLVGTLPVQIAYPIIMLIVLAMIYTIIKLLPFT